MKLIQSNSAFLYKNVETYTKLINKNHIKVKPIFIKNNILYINIDFFSVEKKNKKEFKIFISKKLEKSQVSLIWKLSIKNILFLIEFFPQYKIIVH